MTTNNPTIGSVLDSAAAVERHLCTLADCLQESLGIGPDGLADAPTRRANAGDSVGWEFLRASHHVDEVFGRNCFQIVLDRFASLTVGEDDKPYRRRPVCSVGATASGLAIVLPGSEWPDWQPISKLALVRILPALVELIDGAERWRVEDF